MGAFNKKYSINASSKKVFEALMEEEAIAKWSGNEATMDIARKGKFSLWGGSIHGVNQKISKQQIVQFWKEENWQKFSTVTFNIVDNEGQTEVELIHENIPDSSLESIDNGWDEYYMLPLIEYVERI